MSRAKKIFTTVPRKSRLGSHKTTSPIASICRHPRDIAAAHAKYLASRCVLLPLPLYGGGGRGVGVCCPQRKQGRATGSPVHTSSRLSRCQLRGKEATRKCKRKLCVLRISFPKPVQFPLTYLSNTVDTRATMPPHTQNTLRPTAFCSPSLSMGEGAGGWGSAARNVNRGEPWRARPRTTLRLILCVSRVEICERLW